MVRARICAALLLLSTALAAQQIALQPVATGLNSPLGIVSAGDSRLFVVEQRGQIVMLDTARSVHPFLDASALISCCGERGLLGLAFDPHFSANGFFFVDYTDPSGDVTIARYKVSSSNPDAADPSSGAVVLKIDHTEFANHNGGQLQFGPDGFLYIGAGDGGSAGDPHDHAQDRTQLLGKILRIDVSSLPYGVPSSNPFGNEIWAYGLRNPWRFSFDRITGDLIIGDVGQDNFEEVDFQPASSRGGENYGWRCFEATHPFNMSSARCQGASFTMPVLEYSHAGGACSITGGYRYHGAKYPRLHDVYFYGDYCSGDVFGARQLSDGTWTSQKLLSTRMAISSFGEDSAGELYVSDLNGAVYQIIETSAPQLRGRAAQH